MRIVFMGTPDFAVPCLAGLLEAGHQVCGVFTQPDKPKGRKMVLTPPPVKELALEKGLPVYQPAKMRDGEALGILQELRPELIVVVAYGKILPKEILTLPPSGKGQRSLGVDAQAAGCLKVHPPGSENRTRNQTPHKRRESARHFTLRLIKHRREKLIAW